MLEGEIFLTGGTGSIGRALLRRAHEGNWPCRFTVFSRDEVKQGEVRQEYPEHRYVLGDVRDDKALERTMRGHDLVIHAAAYKQIPAAEVNVAQAVGVNVYGSYNVAEAAVRLAVPRVLGISTDKACGPVNCYGETKALLEKLFQDACRWGATRFNCVRYGNVLGSRGSIVPLFRKQMAEGGTITVTDPSMTRFWLTLDQAVDVILLGLDETDCGTVVVPELPASTMEALAFAVAPRCGVKIIGARPGEKTHEQLVHAAEAMHTDKLGGYFRIWPAYMQRHGNLPAGFEYRSDTARQLTVAELREMVNAS